ncbi:OmpA family protein [Cytophaga hutchinsonii]|uniref:Possible outer membrane protein n=1 Tax=Cytophaga hutchinsonii (strain ATCC 33406 / DSM 1761 / CIP 103989 / NBRC 15051 / NCIMB 9469 / D465) TaxID=269798 RepID=A0A6N4SXL7_CYTH3|nr:OmpA family protein [Cytophaga hutchinsonii]ABG60968.1 possible outer membrane protein [Cytophaga hutchinsonii ATCC 33406]SFX43447.1 Outer membrane protein OmpA [Cytophaga hutchinsonii ATCC 33406]
MRIFLIFFLFTVHVCHAQQEVRWACKVIETDETYRGKWFSPEHVLGVPNVYPGFAGRESGYAWIAGYNEKGYIEYDTYVKVGFCDPIIAKQIVVVESCNPGAITSITVIEASGNTSRVYNKKAETCAEKSRVLSIPLKRIKTPVVALLITTSGKGSKGWNYIDAIGVASTEEPVDVSINLSKDVALIGNSTPLGDEINTKYTESYPIISSDGEILYFARLGDPKNIGNPEKTDIWYSNRTADGKWSHAQNIGKPLNNEGHNFVSSMTPDVNTLLIANTYKPDGSSLGDGVSVTNHTSSGWELPTQVNLKEFENLNQYTSYFLAADGKTMLMGIQMKDSYGDLDLYVSFRNADKSWTKPMNLGRTVNTFQSEATPFLASDGKTLYFGSTGHMGYGGYDIFMSKRLDDTWKNWSKPINLGPKINTDAGELGFSVPASGDVAYTYAWRNEVYHSDIYVVALSPSVKPEPVTIISGRVLDAKTGKPLGAKIEYDILATGVNTGIANSNPTTGSYKIVLPGGNTYGYRAQVPGYFSVNENITIDAKSTYTEIKVDLLLVPIESGQKVELKNVFFHQSTPNLIETSYPELDRMVEVLKTNPTVRIELDGHTDNQGDAALNLALSEKRVETVKAYLVSKGIDNKRITTRAFGGTKPIAPNNTEENRKKNRRVEIIIL